MLCRILTELKLLMTPVGIIVLSAGVGNDVVGKSLAPTIQRYVENARVHDANNTI